MNEKRLVLLDEYYISRLKSLKDWLPRFLEDVERNSIYLSEITLKMLKDPEQNE